MLLLLLFIVVFSHATNNPMKSVTLGELELRHAGAGGAGKSARGAAAAVGTACQAPGGIVNQNGDCVCCAGWSGPGCATRNKCYETSCSNGGKSFLFLSSLSKAARASARCSLRELRLLEPACHLNVVL